MLLVAIVALVIAGLAAVPLLDEGVLEWFAENADCDGRQCTEGEARAIAAGVSITGAVVGFALLAREAVRNVRGRSEGPEFASGPGDDASLEAIESLARLDEAYGRGELSDDEYVRRRDQLRG